MIDIITKIKQNFIILGIKNLLRHYFLLGRTALKKLQKISVLYDEDLINYFNSQSDELIIICKGPSLASIKYPSTNYDVMMPNTLPFTKETKWYYPPKVDYWIKNRSSDILPLKYLFKVKLIISVLDYSIKYSHKSCHALWLARKRVNFLKLNDSSILLSENKSPEATEIGNVSLATGIYSIYLAIKYSNYKKITIYGLDLFETGKPAYSYSINSLQKNLRYLNTLNIYSGNELIVTKASGHEETPSIQFLYKCFKQTSKQIHIATTNKNLRFDDLINVKVNLV